MYKILKINNKNKCYIWQLNVILSRNVQNYKREINLMKSANDKKKYNTHKTKKHIPTISQSNFILFLNLWDGVK